MVELTLKVQMDHVRGPEAPVNTLGAAVVAAIAGETLHFAVDTGEHEFGGAVYIIDDAEVVT